MGKLDPQPKQVQCSVSERFMQTLINLYNSAETFNVSARLHWSTMHSR